MLIYYKRFGVNGKLCFWPNNTFVLNVHLSKFRKRRIIKRIYKEANKKYEQENKIILMRSLTHTKRIV